MLNQYLLHKLWSHLVFLSFQRIKEQNCAHKVIKHFNNNPLVAVKQIEKLVSTKIVYKLTFPSWRFKKVFSQQQKNYKNYENYKTLLSS